jgi:chorismate mutase / prephenate dehydratase
MTQAEADWLLAECRQKIDAIDLQLRDLLNRRAQIAQEVKRTKDVLGMAVHQPQREEEVLRRVTTENVGPLSAEALTRIFQGIIQEIRALEANHATPESDAVRGTPEW